MKNVRQIVQELGYSLTDEQLEALDGKSFINDLTRESVFEKAYAMRAANPDMDTRTILATRTADSDNLWANPQNQPSAGIPNDENETAALLEFAKQLFQQ